MTPLWLLEQAKEAPSSNYLIAVFAPSSNKPKPLLTTTDPISNRSSNLDFKDLLNSG